MPSSPKKRWYEIDFTVEEVAQFSEWLAERKREDAEAAARGMAIYGRVTDNIRWAAFQRQTANAESPYGDKFKRIMDAWDDERGT